MSAPGGSREQNRRIVRTLYILLNVYYMLLTIFKVNINFRLALHMFNIFCYKLKLILVAIQKFTDFILNNEVKSVYLILYFYISQYIYYYVKYG